MIAEIRTYTANRGMLDDLIHALNELVFPNHQAFGIEVIGLWADRAQNQLTWIRLFDSLEDRLSRLASYEASPARLDALKIVAPQIARPPEVRIGDDVLRFGKEKASNSRAASAHPRATF